MGMGYAGPERRSHRVLVTRNTEYHLRGSRCVAVRSRRNGALNPSHPAVGGEVVGGIGFDPQGGYRAHFGEPERGEQVCFSNDVLTSPLSAVARPSIEVVALYDGTLG